MSPPSVGMSKTLLTGTSLLSRRVSIVGVPEQVRQQYFGEVESSLVVAWSEIEGGS